MDRHPLRKTALKSVIAMKRKIADFIESLDCFGIARKCACDMEDCACTVGPDFGGVLHGVVLRAVAPGYANFA